MQQWYRAHHHSELCVTYFPISILVNNSHHFIYLRGFHLDNKTISCYFIEVEYVQYVECTAVCSASWHLLQNVLDNSTDRNHERQGYVKNDFGYRTHEDELDFPMQKKGSFRDEMGSILNCARLANNDPILCTGNASSSQFIFLDSVAAIIFNPPFIKGIEKHNDKLRNIF